MPRLPLFSDLRGEPLTIGAVLDLARRKGRVPIAQASVKQDVSDVVFDGPVCSPGGLVEATADPEDDLEEPREGDNALALRCAS